MATASSKKLLAPINADGAALATVVGVLVEVPVMLLVVKIANATQHWYELGEQSK